MAAIFLFSSANVLPTRKNNGKAIEEDYQDAIGKMEDYLATFLTLRDRIWARVF